MEEKKLDLNAPLLSVRRIPSNLASTDRQKERRIENSELNRRHSLPSYKSDTNSDQFTKPAAVPFVWEHIPGRPKSESGPLLEHIPCRLKTRSGPLSLLPEMRSVSPRLPPGRVLDLMQQPSKKDIEDRTVFRPQTEKLTKLESSKEGINERLSADSENDDDAYSDALDTLSPTESFSMNCSVSGLSGSDGPHGKLSGTFSTDPQTREFMMSRFLPAAKAMALEPPQYVSRRQPAALEQPKQVVKKVVDGHERPLLNQYGSNIIPYYGQDAGKEESESEDGDYDDSGNISGKACGLVPRFCLKNSLCLLNPLPGMKVRMQAPTSSVVGVGKSSKTACTGSQSRTLKHVRDAVSKPTSVRRVQSSAGYKVENNQNGDSNRFTFSGNLLTTGRSSPHRHSGNGRQSPSRNEAPKSPFHEGAGFLGIPKKVENFEANKFSSYSQACDSFREVASHQRNGQTSGSGSPAVEKTVYIDSVNIVQNSHSNSCSSDMKARMDSSSENFETLVESRGMGEPAAESSCLDTGCLNILKEGASSKMETSGSDTNLTSYSDISHPVGQADTMEGFRLDGCLDHKSGFLESVKVPADRNLDINNGQSLKLYDLETSDASSLQSPLPPPLPKSPSESWLWRALPSVSSRNPFSYSKKPASKMSSTSTKWETIVKTSNLHYDHVRYSEELIAHVPKQSKT